ncbi:DUF6263 family protein [Corynebacterium sp. Q4381]|uniref:DUF6263 family protein n=1 Tax=Corynebacterium sp. Marseille-Q4381 TaxID=3121597 RepID=UPI002FE52CB5
MHETSAGYRSFPSRRAGRSFAAVAAAALALGLSACAGEPDPLEGIPSFPVDAARVRVVEAGEDPQVLAYRDEGSGSGSGSGGEAWETGVEVAGGIAQSVADGAEDVDPIAPAGGDVMTTTLPLTVVVDAAGEPGEGEGVAARAVSLTTRGGEHSELQLGLEVADNEGFIMRWRAADSGQVQTVKMLPPVDSPEAGREVVERSLLQLMSTVVVFPSEPVGVGGSWTVESRVTGDATMLRTTTYTVASMDGDVVELDVDVEERPTQASLRIDNSAAGELDGQSLNVASTSTTSDGRLTVDLTKPLPTAGRVAATTRLVYEGDAAKFSVVQDVTSAVTFGKE